VRGVRDDRLERLGKHPRYVSATAPTNEFTVNVNLLAIE
jgi:hypothetical protein